MQAFLAANTGLRCSSVPTHNTNYSGKKRELSAAAPLTLNNHWHKPELDLISSFNSYLYQYSRKTGLLSKHLLRLFC